MGKKGENPYFGGSTSQSLLFDPDISCEDLSCTLISPFRTTGPGLTGQPSSSRPSMCGEHNKGRESPNLCWRAASWLPAPSLCRPLAHSCPSLRWLREWPEQPGLESHQLCGPAHPHLSLGEQWRICSHLPKCDSLKNKQKAEWGRRHPARRGQLQASISHSPSAHFVSHVSFHWRDQTHCWNHCPTETQPVITSQNDNLQFQVYWKRERSMEIFKAQLFCKPGRKFRSQKP